MPIPAAFDLSGRVAVVTGAGGPDGIGFATARLLAELGAAVMISATTARIQDRVSELRSAGFDAGIIGDLTDADRLPSNAPETADVTKIRDPQVAYAKALGLRPVARIAIKASCTRSALDLAKTAPSRSLRTVTRA